MTGAELEQRATNFGIDPRIIHAIISQESNWNNYALRYEPEWRYLINPESHAKQIGVTVATEIHTQSMSWGLGQLMGSVVRELGYAGPMGLLFQPDLNLKYLCMKVKEIEKTAKSPGQIFSCYNWGMGALSNMKEDQYPNQEYVNSCMQHYKEYLDAQ